MHPADLGIREVGRQLRDGRLSAVALARAHFTRIAELNPQVHAFVELTEARALKLAEAADADLAAGIDRGPLHGIPFAVKDIIDVAGLPTRCGSHRPALPANDDAEAVARLVAAGAVLLGKVATYEFALVGPSFDQPYPPARNPWNTDHITGGSSSGSAAAVASGMVRLALGTDTGGSVRSPACYCGVTGLKPSVDALPRHGVYPLSDGLDHVGIIAASADEAGLAYSAMTKTSAATGPGGLAGLRIGYARDWFADDPACAPEVIDALDTAASMLSLAGARISLVQMPDYALMEAAGAVILHIEALALHRAALRAHGEHYGRQAYQSLAAGVVLTPDDLAQAQVAATRLRTELDVGAFAGQDALLTACVLAPAPPMSAFADDRAVWTAMRTLPFNLTGHPALALPAGFAQGLPLGLQLVGRHGAELLLCQIGAAFETATDHSAQRPPLLQR